MKIRTAAAGAWKQRDLIATLSLALRTAVLSGWKQCGVIATSSWLAVPISAILAFGFIWCFYLIENYSGSGEPFAWFEGISAWPSIAIILFAAFLSLHFICKTHVD